MRGNLEVKQADENVVAVEVMAQAIVDIGAAMKRISNSRLNRKALVILVSFDTGQPQYKINAVLDSLESLEKTFLTPTKK